MISTVPGYRKKRLIVFQMNIRIITRASEDRSDYQKEYVNMSIQEDSKVNVEQKSDANLDDLKVEGGEDNVKGGRAGYWEYRVAATGETFNS